MTLTLLEQLALAGMPYLPALIGDFVALFKKYPQLSPEQITAMVQVITSQSDQTALAALAEIAADQAAHPAH